MGWATDLARSLTKEIEEAISAQAARAVESAAAATEAEAHLAPGLEDDHGDQFSLD
jgi:hypothetical protein